VSPWRASPRRMRRVGWPRVAIKFRKPL
jgi:hypothetical protein